MLAKTLSFTLVGLEGRLIEIEADLNNGIPSYELVGLADTAVRESKERVRSAVKNSGAVFPNKKITVNLAPADLKKEGAYLDLAIAAALLKASGQLISADLSDTVFLGELALDGALRAISGILPILISAKEKGFLKFIIPEANANEAKYLSGIEVYAASSLSQVTAHFTGGAPIPKTAHEKYGAAQFSHSFSGADMSFIKGQFAAKRALEIAVSGGHNILLVGPPGTGKTMLAKAIPQIMPEMSFEEALEVTKIHSVAGLVTTEGIVSTRPFRSPHHTATTVAVCGGGAKVRPGEISLAHSGVLFLDEMPEYKRSTLEALRQPLEDGVISISRANFSVMYPARFMLCASMNPCPCGNLGNADKPCVCKNSDIRKYRAKISGPLLDRIDLQVEVDNVKYDDLISSAPAETSAQVRARVQTARKIQRERFSGTDITCNAQMGEGEIKRFCALDAQSQSALREAFERLGLSVRARSRIIKVAKTIADLDFSEEIKSAHILEAVSYRSLDNGNYL